MNKKRVRISNDSLNSYGTRVLTSGINIEQYQRNPVLLYMHERGNVIGYVKDIKVENDEVTGELVFDEVTELSKRCKKQYEFGSLKMVSAGLDILETSEEAEMLVPGQTSPTITKSKLFEVSLVDIGANDDAIVLKKDGKRITLGKESECPLPQLKTNKIKTEKEMDQKTIAQTLGMPGTATESEILAKLGELKRAKEENEHLKQEKATEAQRRITTIVEKAITEHRIGADKKEQFMALGEDLGAEKLESLISAMAPQVKLTSVLSRESKEKATGSYGKLSEVPEEKILEMRKNEPEEYKRLYKAEYGIECEGLKD